MADRLRHGLATLFLIAKFSVERRWRAVCADEAEALQQWNEGPGATALIPELGLQKILGKAFWL
jgi:hypothetical protein